MSCTVNSVDEDTLKLFPKAFRQHATQRDFVVRDYPTKYKYEILEYLMVNGIHEARQHICRLRLDIETKGGLTDKRTIFNILDALDRMYVGCMTLLLSTFVMK
jgi:hypothetical protein